MTTAELIASNLDLADKAAGLSPAAGWLYDDLRAEAQLALVEAAHASKREDTFRSYAFCWMKSRLAELAASLAWPVFLRYDDVRAGVSFTRRKLSDLEGVTRPLPESKTRACSRCGRRKPDDEFGRTRVRGRPFIRSVCKSCLNAQARADRREKTG